jgi:hypothetical protein
MGPASRPAASVPASPFPSPFPSPLPPPPRSGDAPIAATAPFDDGGIVDEGTSIADEATAFELPFSVGTPALPFAAEPEPAREAQPRARAEAGPLPLGLEEHARLHVELNAGYDEAEVLARYRLDRSTRAALDARIDELKRRDPRSAAAWLEAYQAHAAWLLAVDGADA